MTTLTKEEMAVANALLEWEDVAKLKIGSQELPDGYEDLPPITHALERFSEMVNYLGKAKTAEESVQLYLGRYDDDYADGPSLAGRIIKHLGVDMRVVAWGCLKVAFERYHKLVDEVLEETNKVLGGEK